MSGSTTGNDALSGSNGADAIDLLAGNDSYLGNGGNDSILGGDGLDTIYGGNGDDTILGGNDSDRIYAEAGNDSIDAGAGTGDSVRYNQGGNQAITATISAVGGNTGYNDARVTTASQGNDTIINFENINGSGSDDTFIVNSAATSSSLLFVYGSGGNDTISVNTANNGVMADYNAIVSSTGFTRGVSVDLISGTATDSYGTDSLMGVRGVSASVLNDTILGSNFDDRFRPYGGNDVIDGRGGFDMVDYSGNNSSQSVSVNLIDGRANDGSGGTDTLSSIEYARGGSGNDTLIGNTADNEFRGNGGSDSILGGNGYDIADYANNLASQAVSVNLGTGRANDGLGGTDTLSSIEYARGGAGNDTLIGGDANERFRGNAGNDTIMGGNGSEDILDLSPTNGSVSVNLASGIANDGLGGTDRFTGIEAVYAGTGADTLIGGAGNDIFDGGMNGDRIEGGLGADRVRYGLFNGNNSAVTRGVSVDLAAQRATDAWGGADTLIGIERVTGTNFADTMIGDRVSNRFSGLAGNDSIDGGLGSDWLELQITASTAGVTVNLTTGTAFDGTGGTDRFVSLENVIGGAFADHLTGIAQEGRATSRLRGGAGNDTLVGIDYDGLSNEFVVADYADQTRGLSVNLASGIVNDGLGGIDQLVNIRGAIMYGDFADTLIGTNGDDWLAPSGGNDSISGGLGFDVLSYDGHPTRGVSVNLATGTANDGDGGTDLFTGIEAVATGYSNDTVIGDGQDNMIALGAGADYADAGGGRDTINAVLGASPNTQVYTINEAGDQLPFTGVTIDLAAGRMKGSDGANDTILNFEDAIGSTMHDSIMGSGGNNILYGAEGNDTINGGGGNDILFGGQGNDSLMGGAGNDIYEIGAADGEVAIMDSSGWDMVSLSGTFGETIAAADVASAATGIEAIGLGFGGNRLHLTAAAVVSVSDTNILEVTGGGDDRLLFDDTGWVRTAGMTGFDTVANAAGNATVITVGGLLDNSIASFITGGDGNDTIGGGNGADTIDGGNGHDIIAGYGGNDSLLGGAGNDSISAGGADDTMMGGAGNDLYMIAGMENGRIIDSGGSDTVSMFGLGPETTSALAGDLSAGSGIEAINLAGTGHRLGLTAASVVTLSDTDVLRVFGSGADRVVFEDSGWARGTTSSGFVTFTNGSATVIAAESLVPAAGATSGNDTLSGSNGADTIDLLAGNDSYLGLAGNDSIIGNDGNDTIYGYDGADSISGGNGAEVIFGGNGNDCILAGNGDDRIWGDSGNDTIDAGDGTSDSILYTSNSGTPINAVISASGGSAGINNATVSSASVNVDNIRGFEVLWGSGSDDIITINSAATQNYNLYLYGYIGNDTIIDNSGQGGIFASYNVTSTSLTSGVSVNLITGVATDGFGGTDSLVGVTAINATSFSDTILGGAGNDRFRGLQGNDLMNGGAGLDAVDYNYTSQAVSVNLLTGRANDGSNSTDTLISIEQARGGSGNDTIIGDGLDNVIRGNAGSDSLDGGAGTGDVVDYSFPGTAASVNLATGIASDGANGIDTITGFERAWGSAGADTLIGGAGNDVLRGNAGNDSINGGAGSADVADYRNATTGISVNMATSVVQDGQGGNDTLNGIEQIWGSIFNDSMLGGNNSDFFVGSAGADTFSGGSGIDSVSYALNPANSTTATQGVSVNLTTGAGRDGYGGAESLVGIEVIYASSLADTISGGAANEMFLGDAGNDQLSGAAGNDTLDGGNGDDTITGGAGDESILGGNGADLIDGGDNNDTIYGGAGNDSIQGGNGDDRIYGEAGNDSIDAGAGTSDRIAYNQTSGEAITATITSIGGITGVNAATVSTATQGTDNIQGFEILIGSNIGDRITVTSAATQNINLFLFGGSGNDTIIDNYRQNGVFADYFTTSASQTSGISVNLATGVATDGFGGTDSLVGVTAINGTSFADTLLGSTSNDRFRGGQGNDRIDGGAGTSDMVDYANLAASQAVSVNLASGRANDGQGGTDTLISIEQVRGSAGNDTIIGDGADNIFRGNAGNDSLDGGAGTGDVADYAFATAAVSVNLTTGRANDGQGGTDTLANIERVWGSAFADTLIGGAGNDVLRGNAGNDSINGGAGSADVADYRNATTGISVNMATSVVQDGQGGNDTLNGIEQIWGSIFNDSMLGSSGSETFVGSSGNDTFSGGSGIDGVSYAFNPANSTDATQGVSINLVTGVGRDGYGNEDRLSNIEVITGSSLADTILGNRSGSRFLGDAGNDSLSVGIGTNTLDGGAGNDTLSSGVGNDSIVGGSDRDLLNYGDIGGSVTVFLGAVRNGEGDASGAGGNDTFTGIEDVLTGSGNDRVKGDLLANNLSGGAGNDTLLGDGGNDTLTGGLGSDSLNGGNDLDWVSYAELTGAVTVNLTTGRASGAGGADTLSGIENVLTGAGNDRVTGSALDNILSTGAGNDTLSGEGGNDTLAGGLGDDSIVGGTGRDLLSYADISGSVMMYFSEGADGGAATGAGGVDNFQGFEDVLTGAGNDSVSGNNSENMYSTGAGDDSINGRGGNDTLLGGLGNDSLEGGSGADHFIFNTALGTANVDRIQSYNVTDDTILLDDAIFTALGSPGALAAGAFKAGAAATDADDRIIYNATTGALFYDQDGTGATAAVQFATLTSITGTITHADFLII